MIKPEEEVVGTLIYNRYGRGLGLVIGVCSGRGLVGLGP